MIRMIVAKLTTLAGGKAHAPQEDMLGGNAGSYLIEATHINSGNTVYRLLDPAAAVIIGKGCQERHYPCLRHPGIPYLHQAVVVVIDEVAADALRRLGGLGKDIA